MLLGRSSEITYVNHLKGPSKHGNFLPPHPATLILLNKSDELEKAVTTYCSFFLTVF